MRPCLGQPGWDQPGWGCAATWANPQLDPRGHSWIPKVMAFTRGRGVDAVAVPMAPGQHWDRDAGSVQHRGAGGRGELLTQPPASHLELDFQRTPGLSFPSHPCSWIQHLVPPWAPQVLGKELTQSPALPQHPIFC